MIREIQIENYKSIEEIKLNLGRFNIFIGENGAGKSNLLEAIALVGAAQARKLDNEFLASRGIRVTHPQWMRSALTKSDTINPIAIKITDNNNESQQFLITSDNSPYPQWNVKIHGEVRVGISSPSELIDFIKSFSTDAGDEKETKKIIEQLLLSLKENIPNETPSHPDKKTKKFKLEFNEPSALLKHSEERHRNVFSCLSNFIIYSPENTALRTFEREGQIEPLGINGEGLLKLLSVFEAEGNEIALNNIKSSLKLLGWFKDFRIIPASTNSQSRIEISDRWVHEQLNNFDQKSSNEGFLFLVFYFSLFSSKLTPSFFAVDNVDASLNPKLCQKLITRLYKLSCENDKQVILTTHNPAVLDGLNLDDPEQRLFVISRGIRGQTRIRRIEKAEQVEGMKPSKLSEAFLRGALGGLPKGF